MSQGTYILCGRLGGIGIREGGFTLMVYKVLACILLGNWRLFCYFGVFTVDAGTVLWLCCWAGFESRHFA